MAAAAESQRKLFRLSSGRHLCYYLWSAPEWFTGAAGRAQHCQPDHPPLQPWASKHSSDNVPLTCNTATRADHPAANEAAKLARDAIVPPSCSSPSSRCWRAANVVYFHGWPSHGEEAALFQPAAAAAGVHLLAFDRPGVGGSCPDPGAALSSGQSAASWCHRPRAHTRGLVEPPRGLLRGRAQCAAAVFRHAVEGTKGGT
jgi:pimeloyl-ACP methyl ester carboxylesterase